MLSVCILLGRKKKLSHSRTLPTPTPPSTRTHTYLLHRNVHIVDVEAVHVQSDGAGGDGALHHDGARALERELRRVVTVDVGLKTNLVVQGLNTAWESDRQKLRQQEVNRVPSNHAGSIRKCTGYGQLWPLRAACGQNRAGSYMPDPTSRVSLVPFFQRRHGPYCA